MRTSKSNHIAFWIKLLLEQNKVVFKPNIRKLCQENNLNSKYQEFNRYWRKYKNNFKTTIEFKDEATKETFYNYLKQLEEQEKLNESIYNR